MDNSSMNLTNYHTHTFFCDGYAEPVSFVEEAIRQGISSLGFSAHAPVNFPTSWTMKPERVGDFHKEIHRLKREYAGSLDIYCGLEADFFPDIMPEIQALYSAYTWDYIIGSIHFIGIFPNGRHWSMDSTHEVFVEGWREIMNSDPLEPIRKFFEISRQMVRVMKPDIIGHLDKIKMQYRPDCMVPDTHPFFREQVMATLEEIAATNCIVEINTKGQTDDFFPAIWTFPEMHKMGIPVMINSDAHTSDALIYRFEQAKALLLESGYRTVMMLKNGKWEERAIT